MHKPTADGRREDGHRVVKARLEAASAVIAAALTETPARAAEGATNSTASAGAAAETTADGSGAAARAVGGSMAACGIGGGAVVLTGAVL